MSLFRNKEVKLIIVTSFLTFLVFLSTFIFITYNWFNEINKKIYKSKYSFGWCNNFK